MAMLGYVFVHFLVLPGGHGLHWFQQQVCQVVPKAMPGVPVSSKQGEADHKEQFDAVSPAIAQIKQQQRWNATTLSWSVHKANIWLDRVGVGQKRASSTSFPSLI